MPNIYILMQSLYEEPASMLSQYGYFTDCYKADAKVALLLKCSCSDDDGCYICMGHLKIWVEPIKSAEQE